MSNFCGRVRDDESFVRKNKKLAWSGKIAAEGGDFFETSWPYGGPYGPTSDFSFGSLENKAESRGKQGYFERSRFLSIEVGHRSDTTNMPLILNSNFQDPEEYQRFQAIIKPQKTQS
ncbi:hypothetical protein AYI68_g4990 [Smittium mucronatum]|uniref:Uncharacterized protein n=1 Tax=Smittium mucronatum TaxID=133383 RepID=A0A1R0GVN5_9FUNG|nr:hypothetical protein AYI68_g4990 [Smittium mucronatum]